MIDINGRALGLTGEYMEGVIFDRNDLKIMHDILSIILTNVKYSTPSGRLMQSTMYNIEQGDIDEMQRIFNKLTEMIYNDLKNE